MQYTLQVHDFRCIAGAPVWCSITLTKADSHGCRWGAQVGRPPWLPNPSPPATAPSRPRPFRPIQTHIKQISITPNRDGLKPISLSMPAAASIHPRDQRAPRPPADPIAADGSRHTVDDPASHEQNLSVAMPISSQLPIESASDPSEA
ncbi:hypothetical protein ACLOJK_018971 [Asimina triloba]